MIVLIFSVLSVSDMAFCFVLRMGEQNEFSCSMSFCDAVTHQLFLSQIIQASSN